MKRLATRDFKDLLQVGTDSNVLSVLMVDIFSVHFRSSKDYCPIGIIRSYLIFCLIWQLGMDMRSCACIPRTPSVFSTKLLLFWDRPYATLPEQPVITSTLQNYLTSMHLEDGVNQN
jgi:hypothetical protein